MASEFLWRDPLACEDGAAGVRTVDDDGVNDGCVEGLGGKAGRAVVDGFDAGAGGGSEQQCAAMGQSRTFSHGSLLHETSNIP